MLKNLASLPWVRRGSAAGTDASVWELPVLAQPESRMLALMTKLSRALEWDHWLGFMVLLLA
ncbi:hypothetical protein D3C78_1976150 [compost metagenome]